VTGGIGAAVTVLVLVALIVLAGMSFFTNMLTAVLVSLGIPVAVLLHALVGTLYAAFAIATLAILAALIHTITDTLRLMREAKRTTRRRQQARAQRREADRSRIAA
jgi:TRAP-type C4-dicarboxylate transport system permease small subunit